ncbi:glycosyltransferase [Acidiplasma sp.]|uniref:glycosyltransferase n=1 Tax=Acidiplasma sp. TaxID=1872114 RepID=UPI00258FC8AF|nr:glycosyltransferase [Acidiplasma sp.]
MEIKKAMVIDEFSRIGGGQVFANILINFLVKNHYQTFVESDRYATYLNAENIIKTPYKYYENIPFFKLYYYALKTKRFMKDNNKGFQLIINNHPNVFLYKGNINVMHGFSFLDPIIDSTGQIINKTMLFIIKTLGIYKLYNKSNFMYNSIYTENLAKNLFPVLGIKPSKARVIYIPVENHNIDLSIKQKNRVISIGRIHPDKHYEYVFEIARHLKNYDFTIAGAVNKGMEAYYKSLLSVKPNNVNIIPNIDNDTKIELYRKSSIYLHLNPKENYGISVLEAMSYGLIPVVPESGGPWIDIVSRGKFGYSYKNIYECPDIIKGINYEDAKNIHESVNRFSQKNFEESMLNFINDVIN